MRPELSVIIPMRDAETTIQEQLDALAASVTDVEWELVIVDDGSRDNSLRIVEDAAASFPVPLHIVRNPTSRGAGAARNAGVMASRGGKLAFCDADDIVWPDWVDAASRALETAMVRSGLSYVFTGTPSTERFDGRADGTFANAAGPSFSGSNFAVDRELFFAVGGFDESLGSYGHEDSELSIRLGKAGHWALQARDMRIYRRETSSRRKLLAKTWHKSAAQYVMFQRHPDIYGHMLADESMFRQQLLAMPKRHYELFRAGQRQPVADTVRDAITWSGYERGRRAWERRKQEPRYIGPDPLAQEA